MEYINYDSLQTGDIVLFSNKNHDIQSYISSLIKYFTSSQYNHIGMIVRDPDFTENPLKGIYIWQSSFEPTPDPQDGKIKIGVQLTKLEQCFKNEGNVVNIVRRVNCPKEFFSKDNLKEVHKVVYDKPYDFHPEDWIGALIKKDPEPQKTDRFWCSALVGYIYTKCGLLDEKTNWSILRPSDFALASENLNFNHDCSLENKEYRLK